MAKCQELSKNYEAPVQLRINTRNIILYISINLPGKVHLVLIPCLIKMPSIFYQQMYICDLRECKRLKLLMLKKPQKTLLPSKILMV